MSSSIASPLTDIEEARQAVAKRRWVLLVSARARHPEGPITQERAAQILGVEQTTYAAWETLHSCPRVAKYRQLAAFLELSLESLMREIEVAFGVSHQISISRIKRKI